MLKRNSGIVYLAGRNVKKADLLALNSLAERREFHHLRYGVLINTQSSQNVSKDEQGISNLSIQVSSNILSRTKTIIYSAAQSGLYTRLSGGLEIKLNKFLFFHSALYRSWIFGPTQLDKSSSFGQKINGNSYAMLSIYKRAIFRTAALALPGPLLEVNIPPSWGQAGRDICTLIRLNSFGNLFGTKRSFCQDRSQQLILTEAKSYLTKNNDKTQDTKNLNTHNITTDTRDLFTDQKAAWKSNSNNLHNKTLQKATIDIITYRGRQRLFVASNMYELKNKLNIL